MEILNHCLEIQFTQDDIISLIGQDVHAQIISKDRNPLYKKYVIAHEGESKPRVIGVGQKIINWTKDSVLKIYSLIDLGIQCISGHTRDNTNYESKETIAQVVGKKLEIINNKLSTVIAVYFPDKSKSNFDVVSMEASQVIVDRNNFVQSVGKVLRVALGRSEYDTPAFAGAKEIGSYQFFEEIENKKEENKFMENKLTLQQLREIIRDAGYYPSQVFPEIESIIGKPIKESDGSIVFVGGDDRILAKINKAIPQSKEFEKQISDLQTQIESLKKENSLLKTESAKANIRPMLEKISGEKKLSDIQKKIIDKRIGKFKINPESTEIEKDFSNWIDEEIEIIREVTELTPELVGAGNVPKPDKQTTQDKDYI